MELNPKMQAFIEKLGLLFERLGSTRTAGRMMGLMLAADAPMSLADMAESLNVSKASMSTNARLAEQLGMVCRVSLPGDRRDYYELTPRSFEEMVGRRIKAIEAFVQIAKEGLEAIDKDNERARARMENMRDFYQFFLAELDSSLKRWHERKHAHSE